MELERIILIYVNCSIKKKCPYTKLRQFHYSLNIKLYAILIILPSRVRMKNV